MLNTSLRTAGKEQGRKRLFTLIKIAFLKRNKTSDKLREIWYVMTPKCKDEYSFSKE